MFHVKHSLNASVIVSRETLFPMQVKLFHVKRRLNTRIIVSRETYSFLYFYG